MEVDVTSEIENDRQVFRVGDLLFDSLAEAEEFLEWLHWLFRRIAARTSAAQMWAGHRQGSSDTPAIHEIATSLAYLSFVLAGMGAVEQMHLSMIRQIKERLEKAVQAREGAKVMTKGDVAVIMGDEWAKANLGTSLKDKLRTAGEPAPPEWVEMARAKQAALKKTPSPGM